MTDSNGDTNKIWEIDGANVVGIGSFHKTLPHNKFGEVDRVAFESLAEATRGDGTGFAEVPRGASRLVTDGPDKGKKLPAAPLTNPQAGLATDQLTHPPIDYRMPPAPRVTSNTTAAEMVELYWMACLRDNDLCDPKSGSPSFADAVDEINKSFQRALESGTVVSDNPCDRDAVVAGDGSEDKFILGVDLPGSAVAFEPFKAHTLFRLGLPGDEDGPMVSQFFLRPIAFGTQTIDARQRPYKEALNYLTDFGDWLKAQDSGRDRFGQGYSKSNEDGPVRFEDFERYFATMRDLARFVNKDALHQAYFNAALLLLSGGARWPTGNPYHDFRNGIVQGPLPEREAGFGVLGGPHILALVSEVATRALKVVWQQKWQQHLRLRPEAYGGLVHVQNIGVSGTKRPYGLPKWLFDTDAAKCILKKNKGSNATDDQAKDKETLLLPMAFTPGSPTHPAYGAGHATVAGACVTVLKAYFLTFVTDAAGNDRLIPFCTLRERSQPYDPDKPITSYCANLKLKDPEECLKVKKYDNRMELSKKIAQSLTIEGELNKLAQNVAMGRSMGGVHWRTDNSRSLVLGEALAAEILADITTDSNEKPSFTFRTFARRADGLPKKVLIERGRIYVDGVERTIPTGML